MTELSVLIIVFAIFALGVVAGGSSKKPDTQKSYTQRKPHVYVRKR